MALQGVTVNWTKVPYENLFKAEDCYWYVIERDGKAVYIGNAHFQYIDILIKLNVKDFGLEPEDCSFWLGYIILSDFPRMEERLVKDIENLLVYANQPFHNGENKDEYWGSDNIYVRNIGCPVLREYIRSEDKKVLDTKFDLVELDVNGQ